MASFARLAAHSNLANAAFVAWLLWLAVSASFAQHGTPAELRHVTPTIRDAEPGQEPAPESASVAEVYRRQPVFYRSHEAPGTIVIDTARRFLYLVGNDNVALRYGVGVGRDGFQWNGLLKVTRKAEWPDWTPPAEMIERQPYLPRFMAGGPGNPMGARALYLGNTVYRIHGTNAPGPSGMPYRRGASGWSTSRSQICMSGCPSVPRSLCNSKGLALGSCRCVTVQALLRPAPNSFESSRLRQIR